MFEKELTIIKQIHQKNACFAIIGTLKILDSILNHMFVTNVMMFWWLLMNWNISVLHVKGADFRCILLGISRDEAVNRLNNSALEDQGFL